MSTLIQNLFSVAGRTALVTGGTSGIGFMIATGLVENGCTVYVTGLESDPIESKVAELNALGERSGMGGKASGFSSNLLSKSSIEALTAHISSLTPHLDILISNAGIRRDPPIPYPHTSKDNHNPSLPDLQTSLLSTPSSHWSDTFATNVTAHYFLISSLAHLLSAASTRTLPTPNGTPTTGKEAGCGVAIVTSSVASMHNCTNVDLTSYAASKAATDHLVRLLATKLRRWYVRVVGINPGFVPTNMNPDTSSSDGNGDGNGGNQLAALFDSVPAKRVGCLEDLAGTVLYLVSRAGAYVDGTSVVVDGGRLLVANSE